MKQKSTFLKVFMTLLLLMGVSSVWAETATITFKSQTSGTSDGSSAYGASNFVQNAILSSDEVFGTITCNGTAYCYSGKTGYGLKCGSASNNGSFTLTFSKELQDVSKITFKIASYNTTKTAELTVSSNKTELGVTTTPSGKTDFTEWEISELPISSLSTLTVVSTKYCYIKDITITYTPPQRKLQSIYIDGTASEFEYFAGDEFNPAGLKVMGKYNTGDDTEITNGITWSFDPEILSLGTTSVSVTAKVGEFESEPYNVNVTVTEKPVLPSYTLVTDASTLMDGDVIVFGAVKDDDWFANAGINGKYLDATEATYNNGILESNEAVEITLKKTTDDWFLKIGDKYINTTAEKALTFGDEALTAWTISIDGDNNATVSAGENYGRFLYNAQYPRFLNYASGTSASMLLPQIFKKKDTQTQTVTISSVGYSTYSSAFDLVVPADETVYGAKVKNENSVELIPVEEGTIIKAGEGFIVKGTANATVTFTVSSEAGEAISGNELLGTGNETLDLNAGEAYLLGAKDGKAVFALCNEGTLGANKACLPATTGANGTLGFDDATGIEFELQDAKSNVVRYNLNGQVVGNDYKGIVIVNGKKFLNK